MARFRNQSDCWEAILNKWYGLHKEIEFLLNVSCQCFSAFFFDSWLYFLCLIHYIFNVIPLNLMLDVMFCSLCSTSFFQSLLCFLCLIQGIVNVIYCVLIVVILYLWSLFFKFPFIKIKKLHNAVKFSKCTMCIYYISWSWKSVRCIFENAGKKMHFRVYFS